LVNKINSDIYFRNQYMKEKLYLAIE
jgi:hypothetical protein